MSCSTESADVGAELTLLVFHGKYPRREVRPGAGLVNLVQMLHKATLDRGLILPIVLPKGLHDTQLLEGAVKT